MWILLAVALSVQVAEPVVNSSDLNGDRVAATCFKKGETVDGSNKICFYDCLGSGTAITIKSYQICPVTIDN